jgi:radical SAM-linked protein
MRVRLRFAKVGKVRFTSHRDLARIWERALRRAEIPLVYSQGFSPRPRLHFGLALPTGAESWAEYLDADLVGDEPPPDGLAERLTAVLPAGIDVTAAAPVEPGETSLQQAVECCDWRIEVPGAAEPAAAAAVAHVLSSAQLPLPRERKGPVTVDDVRPYIERLEVVGPTDAGTELTARLGTQPRGLRPAELVAALANAQAGLAGARGDATAADGPVWEPGRVIRTHQWMQRDGARQEPLPTATSAPHAEARAS